MTEQAKIEVLHRHLVAQRRKAVETAAQGGALPTNSMLAHLSNLDCATLVVKPSSTRESATPAPALTPKHVEKSTTSQWLWNSGWRYPVGDQPDEGT